MWWRRTPEVADVKRPAAEVLSAAGRLRASVGLGPEDVFQASERTGRTAAVAGLSAVGRCRDLDGDCSLGLGTEVAVGSAEHRGDSAITEFGEGMRERGLAVHYRNRSADRGGSVHELDRSRTERRNNCRNKIDLRALDR